MNTKCFHEDHINDLPKTKVQQIQECAKALDSLRIACYKLVEAKRKVEATGLLTKEELMSFTSQFLA